MMPVATQQHNRITGKSTKIDLPQAGVHYHPALLSQTESQVMFASLLKPGNLVWRCDEIRMFGRRIRQPRLTVWVADPNVTYRYSGICMSPEPWIPMLTGLRKKVETAAGCHFNSVLINLYRNGSDYMGWHRDNERELGAEPVIASLSLGATRYFDMRHRNYRDNSQPIQRFEIQSGDLLIMHGPTQQHWQHRVPKASKSNQPRINLSFRKTNPQPVHP